MIRVVVADDQALVREGIVTLLELSGQVQVVAQAEDGEAALRSIRELRPEVALLDVRMPGMDGIEVVRALREAGDTTPVVLLTTFDDDDALRRGALAGISAYLRKDVGAKELLRALVEVAAGATLLPAASARAQHQIAERGLSFEAAERPERLTAREVEVLRLMAAGYSNREIGEVLGTTEGTVKNQASSILSKLGVRDRTRAVLKALEMGLLLADPRR
jgi:DNA-binding NarL/FixJ family response regulator